MEGLAVMLMWCLAIYFATKFIGAVARGITRWHSNRTFARYEARVLARAHRKVKVALGDLDKLDPIK